MTHPFKKQAKTGEERADSRYGDTGEVGEDAREGKEAKPRDTKK